MLIIFNIYKKEAIGDVVKKERNLRTWTQQQLADKLGIKSRQIIANWEVGNSYPTLEQMLNLCDLFNCDLDYLLGADCKTREAADIQFETGLSENAISMLREINFDLDNKTPLHHENVLQILDYLISNLKGNDTAKFSSTLYFALLRYEDISVKLLELRQEACNNANDITLEFYNTYNGLDELSAGDEYIKLKDFQLAELFNIQRIITNMLEERFNTRAQKIDKEFEEKIKHYHSKNKHS